MSLTYNGYTFPPETTSFTITKRAVIGATGRRNFLYHQWVIDSALLGTGNTDLTAKIAALEAALVDGGDLTSSLGGHQLLSASTTQGTHVRLVPRYHKGYDGVHGMGAELVNRRSFQVIIDGLVPQTSDTDIVAWRESVIGIGNGLSRVVPVGSLTGGVQAQTVQDFTPFFAIQSGYCIALTSQPSPATPLWAHGVGGVYQMGEKFRSGPTSPDYGLNINTHFKVEWSYQFWSATVLAGSSAGF